MGQFFDKNRPIRYDLLRRTIVSVVPRERKESMSTRRFRLTVGLVLLATLGLMSTDAVHAEVWGVKTHDPVSGPPSTLFRFDESGGGLTTVGRVTVGGAPVDVDGLAMDAGGVLYGFQLTAAYSRLIAINTSSAAATVVGPDLTGRDVRGAVFTAGGTLLALDAAMDQVVQIDPTTGLPVSVGTDLTLDSGPYDLRNSTDIAQSPHGSFLIGGTGGNELYSLDVATGQLSLVHTDTVTQPDGADAMFAGLAFSTDAANPETLFTYDVANEDDIWTYETDAAYGRLPLYRNIIPTYNAGRGDLATAPVPEPATLPLLALGALVLRKPRQRRRSS